MPHQKTTTVMKTIKTNLKDLTKLDSTSETFFDDLETTSKNVFSLLGKKYSPPSMKDETGKKMAVLGVIIGLWDYCYFNGGSDPKDKLARKFVKAVDQTLIKDGTTFTQNCAVVFVGNFFLQADHYNIRDKTKKIFIGMLHVLGGDKTLPKEIRDLAKTSAISLSSQHIPRNLRSQ